jgi:hypothetical protein
MKYAAIAVMALAGGLALAAPADAQRGGGGGRGAFPSAAPPTPMPVNPGAATHGTLPDNPGVIRRDDARINREGPSHASPTGVANANENAGLSSTTAPADLSGLTTGLTVKDSTGATIGTIARIEKSGDGKIRNVLVNAAGSTRTIRLAPSSLSLSGDVVTTTAPPK